MHGRIRPILLVLVVLFVVLSPARASAAVIDALDSGWWDSGGYHDSAVKNYYVGGGFGLNDRNFLVFDLSELSGVITSATLRLENPVNGYSSPDPTESYTLFDVSTPIAVLRASGSGPGNIPIFNDLGSGSMLGSTTVSRGGSSAVVVQVSFTAAGLAYLQNAVGGQVAIGGALTSSDTNPDNIESLFGFTSAANVRQLDVQIGATAIPEPSMTLLVGVGLLVSGRRRVWHGCTIGSRSCSVERSARS